MRARQKCGASALREQNRASWTADDQYRWNDWHKANVTPIYKTGNRSDPANYRPVSLTSIPCKMFEHIIHTNIMRHLEKYKLLNDEQHGFCSDRSCETQLALSVKDLCKKF